VKRSPQMQLFDDHIEAFKKLHNQKPFEPANLRNIDIPSDDFVDDLVSSLLRADIKLLDYGLDSGYYIFKTSDHFVQYLAIAPKLKVFIFWNDKEPDGIDKNAALARVYQINGIDSDYRVNADGSSNIRLFENGHITDIHDTNDDAKRVVTISTNRVESAKQACKVIEPLDGWELKIVRPNGEPYDK